jgi:hypothetical protein
MINHLRNSSSKNTLMKEDKYDKLLNAAIVLLLVSATVLGYSVYKSYFKTDSSKTASVKAAEQLSITKDSLQSDYANTVSKMDTNLNSVTTSSNDPVLKTKLAEMDVLKAEITTLLKSNGEGDLVKAKYKIEELKLKILLLENKYANAELENKKLQAIIDQLMAERGLNKRNAAGDLPQPTKEIRDKAKKIYDDNKNNASIASVSELPVKSTTNSNPSGSTTTLNTATGMRLSALSVKNDVETETTKTSEANKLNGTFSIKLSNPKPNEDVYIIVIQPDGKTVKTSSWDAGVFSSDEGKKVFTKKVALDATTDLQKVNFSIEPETLTKGAYTMEIWHRSHLIGRSVRTFL